MSVETETSANANAGKDGEAKAGPKKRRRNRNRKRKNVQADNAINASNDGAGSLQGAQATKAEPRANAEDKSDGSSLGHAKKSKRARRRGRGRKPHKVDGPTSVTDPHDQNANLAGTTYETKPKQSGKQQHRNRRSVRRNPQARQSQGQNKKPQSPLQPQQHDGTPKARPKHQHNNAYAALDLGTNNCRLLVAVPQQPGRFRVVDAFSRIVRLGEGLAGSGRLSDTAMDRAVEALKACAGKLASRNMKGVRLIATEACRQAMNGEEFLARVEEEAGLKLEIVDRETEARLAVAGCASLVDRKAKGAVLFDIGGGSSELALLDLRKRKRHDLGPAMVSWTSMPVGVVTLSERHGGGKHVTREIFANMVEEVSGILENFEGQHMLEDAASEGEVHLLGTSGTVTTLAGIHLKLPRYDRRQVDGTWMASKQVDDMIEALLAMSFEDRVRNPCIGQERADLVLAGCAILVAIQKRWPCPRLRVADRGLREGLLTEMMNRDNAWQRRPANRAPQRSNQQGQPTQGKD
ncbi:Ppx/GppA phosphatase family protein [Pseudahrensia aquimaris]|uniref:Ppx/GppA phosphatase family protein n=1 Tax=Pseudahrensia aquimaris TaxID=744461 RepID=A0ABW3FFG3_9HYPH